MFSLKVCGSETYIRRNKDSKVMKPALPQLFEMHKCIWDRSLFACLFVCFSGSSLFLLPYFFVLKPKTFFASLFASLVLHSYCCPKPLIFGCFLVWFFATLVLWLFPSFASLFFCLLAYLSLWWFAPWPTTETALELNL